MTMTGKIKWLFFATVISIFLFTMVPLRTVRADGTGLSISPQQQIVEQGDEFEVDILISTDNATRGAQFDLTFDSSLVRVNSMSQGDFYSGWTDLHGGSTSTFIGAIDNVAGKIEAWGIAIINGTDPGGQMGSGTLATVHMEALSEFTGTSDLILSNVIVTDCDAGKIDGIQLNHGEVTVTGDRDGGGGEEPPPEDAGEEGEQYIKVDKPFSVNPEEPGHMILPGAIVRHLPGGITEIAGSDGVLIAIARDSDAELVPTPTGMKRATHVFKVPNESRITQNDNIIRVYNRELLILTIINEDQLVFTPYGPPLEELCSDTIDLVDHFSAQWMVPLSPINKTGLNCSQIWIGLTDYYVRIIQPVLQWNNNNLDHAWTCAAWWAASENEYIYAPVIDAFPGDIVNGTMDYDYDYEHWYIGIQNRGQSSYLYVSAFEMQNIKKLHCAYEIHDTYYDSDIAGTSTFSDMHYSYLLNPINTRWTKLMGPDPHYLTGLDVIPVEAYNPTTCTLYTNGGHSSNPAVGLEIVPVEKSALLLPLFTMVGLPLLLLIILTVSMRYYRLAHIR
jgi:hypothetical protein